VGFGNYGSQALIKDENTPVASRAFPARGDEWPRDGGLRGAKRSNECTAQ
jgi:hypothetical protein